MTKKISLAIALSLSLATAAVNYPYPQVSAGGSGYSNGTISVNTTGASDVLKTLFNTFRSDFYTEGNCFGANDCARIKFDNANQTVSEGIAYGMLMMVYFSDNTTSYQTHFDKLWKYYQKWSNNRGLMSWKIDGFSNVSSETGASNTASDAEFDVAVALVMAHYQFGTGEGKNYLDTAKALIRKIRQYEISNNNLHKPGDTWDSERNPSYVSPAAFEIFREVESSADAKSKWQSVIAANYTLLSSNQSKSTAGLFSDWCDDSGNLSGSGRGTYSYDAARVPWRLAWANAWYGNLTTHANAKTMLAKVVTFLGSTSASNVRGPLQLNASNASAGSDNNSTFIGPFMNAFSYSSSSTNQTNINSYWSTLNGLSGQSYYNSALRILTGLLATGNMPNLKKKANDNCCTGSETVLGPQIDNLANAGSLSIEDRNFARTWEPWYVFTDAGDKGASTIQNSRFTNIVWSKKDEICEEINDYNVIMQDGSDWVAKIDRYSLSQGQNPWHPYASIGLDAVNNGTSYNLSNCTGGFKYSYKGEAHNFKVLLRTVTDYNYHHKTQTSASSSWKEVTVLTEDLAQETWGPDDPVVDFDLSKIEGFAWEVKGNGTNNGSPITGVSAMTGSLAIKDFFCLGGELSFPAYKPDPKCEANIDDGGNSSSSGGANSSSSSDGGSPIVLSQFVKSNALIPMQNAINLQVTNNAVLQIFDLKGNRVRKQNFTQGSYVVQMADLPKGVYIVKGSGGSWRQTITVPIK
jgi:endo-1,4-beta-D-glucanase Y